MEPHVKVESFGVLRISKESCCSFSTLIGPIIVVTVVIDIV